VAQDYPAHSIVLVDNGSTDDSAARLRAGWGDAVSYVQTGSNLGVAGGYNAGIRAALAGGASYVTLCNNDVVLQPSFVRELVAVFEARPRAGVVAPVMLYFDGPGLIWFAGVRQGRWLRYSVNSYRRLPLSALGPLAGTVFASDYVPTCASLLSREAIERVGLLDERFFFGHDDVDWSLRAQALGFECLVLGRALVRHKVSVTSGVRGSDLLTPRSAYTHALGSVLIGAKHFRNLRALPFFAGLFGVRVPYNVAAMLAGGSVASVPPYLRGIADGLRRYGALAFGPERDRPAGVEPPPRA
jgi:GT2 family glycosyltransferase